ncbi:MAG: hypothetical protein V7K88_15510 [Nostoc sp.]
MDKEELKIHKQDRLKQLSESLNTYIMTHFQASGDRITKALNAELLSK